MKILDLTKEQNTKTNTLENQQAEIEFLKKKLKQPIDTEQIKA